MEVVLPAMSNVQITGNELTAVWTDIRTGRIVGFAPTSYHVPGCICIPLSHASDVDKWANRFRLQQAGDREKTEYEKFMREAPVRKAIRDRLKARRDAVGPLQRADIDRGLMMLDRLEAKLARKSEEGALLIERYDASKRKEDIALESPAFQAKPQLLLPAKV